MNGKETARLALKCILASMDGMTSAAFRSLCFEYGAAEATTEMIPAAGFARSKRKCCPTLDALTIRRPEERTLAAQIIGSEPELMAAAASRLEALERFDAIEINMGCPARTVVGSGNGSAILRDVRLAEEIIRAVCAAVELPVRLKLRLGWDEEHIVAPEIARIAEDAGCTELILHGRTRAQMYSGEVMLEEMLRVREAVHLPIYANGAVERPEDAAEFVRKTRADGVCIGRAALRTPWIFEDIHRLESGQPLPQRDAQERITILLDLAQDLCLQKPEDKAMCEMRRFSRWYLPGLTGAEEICSRLNSVLALKDYRSLLESYLNELLRRNDILIHHELEPERTLDTVRRNR